MSRKHSRAARRKRLSGAATAGRKPLSAQVSEREARLLRELEAERLENLRLRQTIDALQQASAPPAKDANELVPVRKKPRTGQRSGTRASGKKAGPRTAFQGGVTRVTCSTLSTPPRRGG